MKDGTQEETSSLIPEITVENKPRLSVKDPIPYD